jgi:hypothetical protein
MLRVLAGDLSATFNLDGMHLHRYVINKEDKVEKICEQLILHDQVLVPTNDFLTAVGLLEILGENTFIDLLESEQLRFIRLRQVFGYVRGSGRDGSLAVFGDPENLRPQDSPIESSISAGLSNSRISLRNREKISRLLAAGSLSMESASVVDGIREQTYSDFRKSAFWNSGYSYPRTTGLRLPGISKHEVRVLGPETDVIANPVDALLSLAQANIEGFLSQHFDCASTSSASPIGDSVALKLKGQQRCGNRSPDELWSFLKLEGIPDLAAVTCVEPDKFSDLLRLTRSRNCNEFRIWFAKNRHLSEMELCARYVELLHDVPWVNRAPIKALRFLITTVAGKWADAKGLLGVGEVVGFLDSFLADKLHGNSPKYFVADLKTFQGKIGLRSK